MKKGLSVLLFGALLATSLIAMGGQDEKAIEKRLNKGFEALEKQDWETFASLCTSDWVHLNHMGMRWNMEEVKGFFTAHMTNHSIEISNISIQVSGDASMASATFDEKTQYKFDGNPVSESAIFTAVFVKEGDAWKMKLMQRTLVQPPPEMSEK